MKISPMVSIAPTNPRATIATENNVIYSPYIAMWFGGKKQKQKIQRYRNVHTVNLFNIHRCINSIICVICRLVHKLS